MDKLRFCSQPGCTFIATNSRFCPGHQENNYQTARNRHPWYNRRIWRDRIRPMKLRMNPMCEDCNIKPATDVHHIDESWKETEDWSLFLSLENLMSLCHECHSKRTMQGNHAKGVFTNG